MRIIGGHDYYDSGMAWGQDERLIFLRNEERLGSAGVIEEITGIDALATSARFHAKTNARNDRSRRFRFGSREFGTFETKTHRFFFYPAYVILAGTLYTGIAARKRDQKRYLAEDEIRWLWNVEAARSYAGENHIELDEGTSGTSRSWRKKNGQSEQYDIQVLPLEEWLRPRKLESAAREYLVEERITIASKNPLIFRSQINDLHWDIDKDSLGDMDFAKAVDPYTAFQEIAMWVGGVIPRQGPEMVEITDNRIKIEKHGFHHPTSFRRPKQG